MCCCGFSGRFTVNPVGPRDGVRGVCRKFDRTTARSANKAWRRMWCFALSEKGGERNRVVPGDERVRNLWLDSRLVLVNEAQKQEIVFR